MTTTSQRFRRALGAWVLLGAALAPASALAEPYVYGKLTMLQRFSSSSDFYAIARGGLTVKVGTTMHDIYWGGSSCPGIVEPSTLDLELLDRAGAGEYDVNVFYKVVGTKKCYTGVALDYPG